MATMIECKTCGASIAANAKACPSCGAKNKKPVYKRVWFWLVIIFVVFPVTIGIGTSNEGNSSSTSSSSTSTAAPTNSTVSSKPSVFDGDCGISASAEMDSSIIGYPELTVEITNNTNKTITAIQFYVVPYDVYGDEITGWTSQNKCYTDTAIAAGKSNSVQFQFIENSIKTVKLYVYSVYFEDGSEWGDKDATKSTILNGAAIIEVTGQS